jgi:lipoyl(octanoyl) transferase
LAAFYHGRLKAASGKHEDALDSFEKAEKSGYNLGQVNLQRAGYYVKEYVFKLEESIIRTLAHFGVTGHRVAGAPGIYVRLNDPFSHAALVGPALASDPFKGLGKISAVGIKVSRHCTYHGAALNVAMDLQPFERINPCGYAGLQTVDLFTLGVETTWDEVARVLAGQLAARL